MRNRVPRTRDARSPAIHSFPCETAAHGMNGAIARQREPVVMKVRDLIRLLTDDGWVLARQKGSHRQFEHPTKRGLVTVAGKPSDDLAPGTLDSILKQAGLRP